MNPLVFTASDVTMTGDIVVTGDLDITGSLTSFDTTDLSLEDNIISVADSANAGGDGGFQFMKNVSGSVTLKWMETAGEWEVSLADSSTHVIADVAAMEAADLCSIRRYYKSKHYLNGCGRSIGWTD